MDIILTTWQQQGLVLTDALPDYIGLPPVLPDHETTSTELD